MSQNWICRMDIVHSTDKTIDFLWLLKSGCFRDQFHRTTYVMFLDFILDVLGDFLVLTHFGVSSCPCHFLYYSLGNCESRYCWWNLWACVKMLILNKKRALFNIVCVAVEWILMVDHQQMCSYWPKQTRVSRCQCNRRLLMSLHKVMFADYQPVHSLVTGHYKYWIPAQNS